MFKKFLRFVLKYNIFKNVIIAEPGETKEIKRKTIVLTKKGNSYTWANFKCPCGCGETITLSLNSLIEPSWSVEVNQATNNIFVASFSPSIYMLNTKCGSHYFIKDNEVSWCE